MKRPTVEELVRRFGLGPYEHREGGLFTQTWRSASEVAAGTPTGTATIALLTAEPDSFSDLHRLASDEVWHFYLGDPVRILMLHPDGGIERRVLGQDILGGQSPQVIMPAGSWMAARLLAGGDYALFSNTMAPGFTAAGYELGGIELAERYPDAADEIRSFIR